MATLTVRPDFRTSGGESCDIMWNGRFVGSMTLLYREQDRMTGSVQLENESLPAADKAKVVDLVREHIQLLIDALRIVECDVLVTYSSYDHVVATPALEADADTDVEWVEDEDRVADPDPREGGTLEMSGQPRNGGLRPVVYELVVVNEKRNRTDYHIYDNWKVWVAEAFMHRNGPSVTGDVHWVQEPEEDQIEYATDLIVSDYDEDEIDTFTIDHRFEDEVIETIELTHEDLAEAQGMTYRETFSATPEEDDYSIVLARDDGDMITYEVYKESVGALPIGTATVDISRRELAGFIDFRDPDAVDDMETIASLLMRELDKEKDYETFSLTMLYKNEPIDELIFEADALH